MARPDEYTAMEMALNYRDVMLPILGLILLGSLSGCEVLLFATTELYATQSVYSDPTYTGVNHYEPLIVDSDEETIRVRYLDVNSYAQPAQAEQLIAEHCDGSFVETARIKESGHTMVEAQCTK